MAPLRVAIAGCGFIGTVHSFALRALSRGGLSDVRVVACCDPELGRAEQMTRGHPGAQATSDPARAFADADAAWICTPTASHLELARTAARAGLAIYCEKPLARDLDTALTLARAVEEAGVPHQVGLVLRSAFPFVTAAALAGRSPSGPDHAAPETVDSTAPRALRRSGPNEDATPALGRPMAAVFRDDQFFPIQGMYGSTWRGDVAVAGGGTLLEHSIHDLDVLQWLFGPVASVTGRTANHAGHPGIEDVATVTLTHASGTVSSLVSVWHQVLSRPSTRRLEVFFERALAVIDDGDRGPVYLEGPDGVRELGMDDETAAFMARLAVPEEHRLGILAYAKADHDFVEAVSKGRVASPGLEVAVAAHRLADAAYRSAAEGGRPVDPGGA